MATVNKPTRQQRMSNEVTHAEYYVSLAEELGVNFENTPIMAKVKKALADGDKHLNSIPLAWWDTQAWAINRTKAAAAFKSRGDFISQAGLVCILKEAARKAAEK